MKVLEAVFLTSAARAADVPRHAEPQIALVGRSNVGKSSLINALTRSTVARTSAAPGKTRLANLYRIALSGSLRPEADPEARGRGPAAGGRTRGQRPGTGGRWTIYLVDLPGYGYARGGEDARAYFARLTSEYFGEDQPLVEGRLKAAPTTGCPRGGQFEPAGKTTGPRGRRLQPDGGRGGRLQPAHPTAALLVIDARHPGLASDRDAWDWIQSLGLASAVVATKIDKLGRADRTRALGELERALNSPVTAVSAATGEGMDQLWKRIATLVTPSKKGTAADRP